MCHTRQLREVPYRSLPRQPKLFLDYVAGAPQALAWYRRPPSLASLEETAREIMRRPFPRREMSWALQGQSESYGSSTAVEHSLEILARPDSIAVITGQQVGLFGGPVLTMYKALTALRLSEELRRRGYNAVPIFWMASDDHDLQEVARGVLPGADSTLTVLDAREILFGRRDVPALPVGSVRLPETIDRLVEQFAAALRSRRHMGAVDLIAAAYRPGETLATAFGRQMSRLLKDRGLLIFDPRGEKPKRLAASTVRVALEESTRVHEELDSRLTALRRAGVEPQVAVPARSSLVFLEDETGVRRLLTSADDGYRLKETRRTFTREQIRDLIDEAPGRFSPNVLLRPIVQDHLFPTVAYVGGPAEVSYFAQIEPLYRIFQRPMPVIWPRSGFTILDPAIDAALRSLGREPEDCFQGKLNLFRQVYRSLPGQAGPLLASMATELEQGFAELGTTLAAEEASLGRAAETVRRKLRHRVTSLETQFVHFEMRRNRALDDKVQQIMNCCYPLGNLQEREIGTVSLLAAYGPALFETVYDAIHLEGFHHRFLYLDG
jgi:bacillithiol biosynthesis cysteine-adding enzyme BshC